MRFYENRFIKPLPIFLVALFLATANPLNLPPEPKAVADEIVVKPVLVDRTPEASKEYAKSQLPTMGWDTPKQFACLLDLWTGESNWRPDAYNKTVVYQNGKKLHAGGIPQILGLDPDSTVEYQIQKGLEYIAHRYDTPCLANAFWHRNFWY